ncbi:hypothetical protein O181_020715 [Austropuccinia psidii MF-1]|uniref:Uncharacterized protein n=1 Tax=Austropuccinia psidii MF-1 TaxID=1389203 RepID=A0A9Q3GWD1_9BASI|nr:hypothetical protein [Austropuccinia psidii MF-1]
MWERTCDTAANCIAEAKEYNKQRYDQTHKEPHFKEGDQVLVSTLNFNNLKRPKKMRDSFVVHYHQIYRGKCSTGEDKFPSRNKTYTPQDIVEVKDSPDPVKKIIKARNIRLNGKYQRQYLARFKNQTVDKDN